MSSVLITGANGFVGRQTIGLLLEYGFKVHALYSSNQPILQHPALSWHQLNLHDLPAVELLLTRISVKYLLHLAWFTKPDEYWFSSHNITWLNSSLFLLRSFIQAKGERAVFIGSCAEYSWHEGLCHEYFTRCLPQTLYGKSKYSLYLLAEEIARQQSLSFAWARLFYTFGPYEYPERLVPSAICNLMKDKVFKITNSHFVRDYLYVADVAHAIVTLLISDVTGPVNIASGKLITIGNLVTRIAAQLNKQHLVNYTEMLTSDNPTGVVIAADTERLFSEVNWRPNYSFDTAMDLTMQGWLEYI